MCTFLVVGRFAISRLHLHVDTVLQRLNDELCSVDVKPSVAFQTSKTFRIWISDVIIGRKVVNIICPFWIWLKRHSNVTLLLKLHKSGLTFGAQWWFLDAIASPNPSPRQSVIVSAIASLSFASLFLQNSCYIASCQVESARLGGASETFICFAPCSLERVMCNFFGFLSYFRQLLL